MAKFKEKQGERDRKARSVNEAENPKQGFDNPFFRDHEERYDGGDLKLTSPAGSIFGAKESYLREDGSNAMEDAIADEIDGPSRRQNTYGKKQGR
jgi:hypothetical protein